MKKNLIAFIAVLGIVGLFSACSSDDKNDPAPPVVNEFSGLFKGDLVISLEGLSLEPFPDYIEIIKSGDSHATLQLKNFVFEGLELGDIIVPNVAISQKGDKTLFKGHADIMLNIVGQCEVELEATLVGDHLEAEINVEADAEAPTETRSESNKLEITVDFKGDRTDKRLSSEAELLDFSLKDINLVPEIKGDSIKFFAKEENRNHLSNAFALAEISENATISPSLDVAQDFTQPVEYTITAEDGLTQSTYIVATTIEVLSSEAKLLSFSLKDIDLIAEIEGNNIKFFADESYRDQLANAIAVAEISENATISPSLDVVQDFNQPVEYTVTAEDGVTQSAYTVTATITKSRRVVAFDFSSSREEYKHKDSKNNSALPIDQDNFKWDSSDGGVLQLFGFFVKRGEKFGITHNGGSSFSIETLNTKGKDPILNFPATPVITSGSLFLGSFALNTKEPLKSTAFGNVVDSKPLKVVGTASYKTGEEYYYCPNPTAKESNKVERIEGKKDEGLISAVVYEVTDKVKTLDGTNIYTHSNIIGKTQHILVDGDSGDFSFDIDYAGDFDPAKTYKLALILSASKDGDKFSGAGGSVLTVSKLEVVLE